MVSRKRKSITTAPGCSVYDEFVEEYVCSSKMNGDFICSECGKEVFDAEINFEYFPTIEYDCDLCSRCLKERYYDSGLNLSIEEDYKDSEDIKDIYDEISWDEGVGLNGIL